VQVIQKQEERLARGSFQHEIGELKQQSCRESWVPALGRSVEDFATCHGQGVRSTMTIVEYPTESGKYGLKKGKKRLSYAVDTPTNKGKKRRPPGNVEKLKCQTRLSDAGFSTDQDALGCASGGEGQALAEPRELRLSPNEGIGPPAHLASLAHRCKNLKGRTISRVLNPWWDDRSAVVRSGRRRCFGG
jgi:hypothetical protein